MLDKNGALKKLSPKLSKHHQAVTVKKNRMSLVKKIRCFITVDNITFICFRYTLNSLLRIKETRLFHDIPIFETEI